MYKYKNKIIGLKILQKIVFYVIINLMTKKGRNLGLETEL